MEKKCFKCGVTKPLAGFYAHSRMADGHLNKCKECTKKDARAHRYGPAREKVLAYDRARACQAHRVEARATIRLDWLQKHPERRAAQIALGNAVRSGKVVPWPVCAIPECNAKPEAHHPDYSRPLDVVWLCASHHKQAHVLPRGEKP